MWRLKALGRNRSRSRADEGVAATLVALLLGGGVLFGMAALTVDVGQIYVERRQIQNGADAAVLAVALRCAAASTCDTSTSGQSATMAGANANDGVTAITAVCGQGNASLTSCAAASGPVLTQCPAPPTGVLGWVQVSSESKTDSGSTLLPPVFARALTGNSAYNGTTVDACAQAAWGTPTALGVVVPLALSLCEWQAATHNGTAYAPPPPYPPYPPGQVALKFHTTDDHTGCPASAAGADLPGGFGWLDAGGDCLVDITAGGTVPADPGVSGSTCSDLVVSHVGSVIFLPVFSSAWGVGATGTYQIEGFAAFYLSGYNLPGAHPSKQASPVGGHLCRGADKCIYGWFTQALTPSGGSIGSGPGLGAKIVALTG